MCVVSVTTESSNDGAVYVRREARCKTEDESNKEEARGGRGGAVKRGKEESAREGEVMDGWTLGEMGW